MQKKELMFQNEVINKKKLQDLMSLTFHNYGMVQSSIIADRVKNLTFHYATKSSISLSIEDLRVPFRKRELISLTTQEVESSEQKYRSGKITSVERFQKVIDIWNNASNSLKDEVLTYFRESDPFNSLYIMAFSGARGNISQVRQLVGMRGLMADPQGQIIDLPIKSNFREGLNVTEYIISSYGARKGLVDTALRTADSGYLTRRLVDVAQDIIVRDEDCLTQAGLEVYDLQKRGENALPLQQKLIGRLVSRALIDKRGKEIVAPNTEITLDLYKQIEEQDLLSKLKIRSPLTCNSIRSICQKCYGWHLSYSKLVDLGEAIGIIAAQSIGEPGTQLTMRTFHTGGVFSGDLTRQIRVPFSGTINYKLPYQANFVRTMHGEKGFKLQKQLYVCVKNQFGTKSSFVIPSESILLVNNGALVYKNQIVAEIKKATNLIVEEDRKNIYTESAGETYFQNLKIDTYVDKQGTILQKSTNSGLVWVLFGKYYQLPFFSNLLVSVGQHLLPDTPIAEKQIKNTYAGIVKYNSLSKEKNIKILVLFLTLTNATIKVDPLVNKPILHIKPAKNENRFSLDLNNNTNLTNGQILATLIDDSYITETGGIVCYELETSLGSKNKKKLNKVFSGSLYWIPEETHSYSSISQENFWLNNGSFISAGTHLFDDTFSKTSGFIFIDSINEELSIKPGELFLLQDSQDANKFNRFFEAGASLFSNIIIQKLSYVEVIKHEEQIYLLVRPVTIYNVPREKGFTFEQSLFFKEKQSSLKIKTIKRIFFKNGEHIKSSTGVNLLKTFLVLEIKNPLPICTYQFDIIDSKLKFSVCETLALKISSNLSNKGNFDTKINCLVVENQYVEANTILAFLQLQLSSSGLIASIHNKSKNINEVLILRNKDFCTVTYKNDKVDLLVKVGDLIRTETYLSPNIKSPCSGQVYSIGNNKIVIRLGRPYLISKDAVLRVKSNSLIQRSDLIATLVYDKLKTVDIVQGLPKVEEILEARKIKNSCILSPYKGRAFFRPSKIDIVNLDGIVKSVAVDTKAQIKFTNGQLVNVADPLTDGAISPHEMLLTFFRYYQEKLPVDLACKKSFKELQLFLVNEVQQTYLSQNVQIADKHIEVIVKQMTSNVRIDESGDTTLLPGEIINFHQANMITNSVVSAQSRPPFYTPLLLGLTKASLNSDSFISAASFQETTRVLTDAAIEGKKDWLNGLKENVIIGRLIPAGTGFNSYENLRRTRINGINSSEINYLVKTNATLVKKHVLEHRTSNS